MPGRAPRHPLTTSLQADLGDDLVEVVVGHAVEVAVVDLAGGRLGAGGDALDVLDREQPVGRRAPGADAERGLGVGEEFLATAENGEDTYVRCPSCGYAANVEAVEVPMK